MGAGGQQFIAPQFHGTIYLPASSFENVIIPHRALFVVPLTNEELDVYEVSGPSRVTARLCRQSGYYPFPTWCDRTRATVFSAADVQAIKAEPVSHTPRAMLFDSGVIAQGSKLSLSVSPNEQERFISLLKTLPAETALMLSLGVDSRANAFLVWAPGDSQAVTPPGSDGSIMSGSFLEILPGVDKVECRRFGDGYVVMLTNDAWNKLKSSVSVRKDFTVAATEGGDLNEFTITFSKSVYQNPVDGKDYVAEGGWQEYKPNTKKAKSDGGPVVVDEIVLLTDQSKLKTYISVEVLANYVKEIEKTATLHFAQTKKETTPYEMIIDSEVSPGNKAVFRIAAKPEGLSDALVKALYAKLNALQAPAANGPVRFQVLLKLWPK